LKVPMRNRIMNVYQFHNISLANLVSALTCFIVFSSVPCLIAQEHTTDANTLLLLHFNDNLTGDNSEFPISNSGVSFETGIFGNAAYFEPGNQVFYSYSDNLNSLEGTLEFWIKPKWDGGDNSDHIAIVYGDGGGMVFGKDGGNYWRSIFNRYGAVGGNPEVGVGTNVSGTWFQNEWHHAAFTWNSQSVKLYIDGELINQSTVGYALPELSNETLFQIGADQSFNYLDAVLDELRISDIERSEGEIAASFLAGITVTSLTIDPKPIDMLETWWQTPTLRASTTNFGTVDIDPASADWSSSNSSIASVNSSGRIAAVAAGTATITATVNGVSDNVIVNVSAPVLQPDFEAIDNFLATPASQYVHEIPVVILRYLPTTDGINVDQQVTGWTSSLNDLKTRIDMLEKRVKFALETGSRFRQYSNSSARPSLGYRVLAIINVYEEVPKGFEVPWNPGIYRPDYDQMLSRFSAENYVNSLDVKEFWIWGYHHGDIEPAESNMSSPVTGDISNSERQNADLPVFNHTYTVYNYNFTRSQAEAVHDHGHQLEAILAHANILQDGNSDLFWKLFVGQDINDNFITGRCGWTHMPPNTTVDYDYLNTDIVSTDIEDWSPDGTGATTLVNVDTWDNLVFNWPDGETDFPQRIETQFYIYWMQSMPGYANVIQHGSNYMQNWWLFTSNWDSAMQNNMGLYGPEKAENDIPVSVALTSFTARSDDMQIILNWITESELNNDVFILERSEDDTRFVQIAEIQGQGNYSSRTEYSYTDKNVELDQIYYYRLSDRDYNGNMTYHQSISIALKGVPTRFVFYQNYPNPFNPKTTISFALPHSEFVTLKIYNISGEEVSTLVSEELSAGNYRYLWSGESLASGVYLYRIQSGNYVQTRKMILLR